MASIIDYSDLTLNPEEALAVSQAVFEDVYVKGPLSLYHYIQTGIQMKTQIPIFGLLPMLGKKSSGCTPNAATGLNLTEKYWDPELIDFRLTHCQGDVLQLYKMWKRSAQALGTWEQMDSGQMNFIVAMAKDAHMEAILRISSFGDEDAAVVSDGGHITETVDVDFFTMLNGLWKQLFAGVAATTVHRYEITENGQATRAAQLALGDTVGLEVFRDLYNNIDARAFESGTLKFQVTRGILTNWQDLLEDKSLANAVLANVEQGSTKFNYRGIPIEVRHDWDRQIRVNHNLASTYYLPNRALLTTTENIPLGTSDEASMSAIDSLYDRRDKKWYYDGASYLDCKLLQEYKAAVAY